MTTSTKESLTAIRRANLEALISERFEGKQARLAAAVGRPANYVWRLLTSGPHAKGIGEEVARLIEDRLGMSPYSLDRPLHDEPARQEATLAPAQASSHSIVVVRRDSLSTLHAKPSSGWVRRNAVAEVFSGGSYSDGAFAMTVPDSSMEPLFAPGEMIIIDPVVEPEAGDYVLARAGADLVFRRYRPANDRRAGAFMLSAISEDYAPMWSDRETISILGVLVEHHRYRSVRKQTPN